MLSVLIAVRDFLVATALAWVGVTVDVQHVRADQANCAAQACQTQVRPH